MLAACADSELLGANIITGSDAVLLFNTTRRAHAQHPDHQAGSRYRRAAAAAAVLFKTTRRPPDPQAREAGGQAWPTTDRVAQRTGLRRPPADPLRYSTTRCVYMPSLLKIMLKIGGRGERRSSRRSARVFDSRAHDTQTTGTTTYTHRPTTTSTTIANRARRNTRERRNDRAGPLHPIGFQKARIAPESTVMGESHAKREHEQASTRFAFKGPSVTTARGTRLAIRS